jgi:hypothetical protein
MSIKKLLLISGQGNLPIFIYQNALKQGIEVVQVGFRFLSYDSSPTPRYFLDTFSFSSIYRLAQELQIDSLCLAGKISRTFLFQEQYIGNDIRHLLSRLSGYQDNQVLEAIFQEFAKHGLCLISPADFLSDSLTPLGNMTRRTPDEKEWEDIQHGSRLARYLVDCEVGQTVILKRKAILAIEAAEGTDKAIQRGAELGGGNVVVVKLARTRQDFFIDIPAIGSTTIQMLAQNGGGILAVEHKKTLLLNREELVRIADDYGVGVIGISSQFQ